MAKIISKLFPVLILWFAFVYVLFNVDYPQTLVQASWFQFISFFLTLFLAILFTLNIFLSFLAVSFFISLGLIILLLLQALHTLNLVTGILTIVAIWLFISYFKKAKRPRFTKFQIPKLQLSNKNNRSKLRGSRGRRG